MEYRKKQTRKIFNSNILLKNKVFYRVFKMKGSYTMEVVFVVPIILGLIFAMIYVMYYLHDKAVIYCNVQQAVVHVAEGKKEYKDDEEWKQDMQDSLWIFQVESGSVNKDKLYIKSEVTAKCLINIPIIGYFIDSKQEIMAKDKYLAVHPEFIERTKSILKN